jgi:hypothetical protein
MQQSPLRDARSVRNPYATSDAMAIQTDLDAFCAIINEINIAGRSVWVEWTSLTAPSTSPTS